MLEEVSTLKEARGRSTDPPATRPGPIHYEPTFNQVQTIKDPLNHTTTFGYDGSGKLEGILLGEKPATTRCSDGAGRLASLKGPSTIRPATPGAVRAS
jgi:YD repeat-containing protein